MCRCVHQEHIENFAASGVIAGAHEFTYVVDHEPSCAGYKGWCCNCSPTVIVNIEPDGQAKRYSLDPAGGLHFLQ